MIIIGYQGIGKSTMAKTRFSCIDLESGNFFVDGKRSDDWYKIYVKIAEHLSEQGYIVFVSSHKVVRDELSHVYEPVGACYPALELKDAWIKKLKKRYNESGLEKDYRAWMNAEERFTENIKEMEEDCDKYGFSKFVITGTDYELIDIIGL